MLLPLLCFLLYAVALAQNQYDVCPGPNDVFINCGGKQLPTGFRCDTGAYVKSSPSWMYTTKRPMDEKGTCIKQYESHRYASGTADLVYEIPVPPGQYMVYLMFMEVWLGATNGTRFFDVSINGEPMMVEGMNGTIDIYSKVGVDNPVFVNTTVQATNAITVKLGRSKQNPMISGIGIKGPNANQIVGDDYLKSCDKASATVSTSPAVSPTVSIVPPDPTQPATVSASPSAPSVTSPDATLAPPSPPPPPNPSPSDPCAASSVTTNFLDDKHVAHAVSGGPYVETDFLKEGSAVVELDGLGSHSHESDPDVGVITKYTWSWKDSAGVTQTADGPVVAPTFPLGVTDLTLEVQDQYCNKAAETTTVSVNPSTMPGAYCYYYDQLSSEPSTVPIPVSLLDGPKPMYAAKVGDINFGSTASFGSFPFIENSFAVRCIYSIEMKTAGTAVYQVTHSGPMQMFYDGQLIASSDSTLPGQKTNSKSMLYPAGFNGFQILYVRPASLDGTLKLAYSSGAIVPPAVVRHDSATILPVITSVDKIKAFAGEFVTIKGSAFINGVIVRFGNVIAEPVQSLAGSILLRVPEAQNNELIVDIVVSTNAGSSNGWSFTYGQVQNPCEKSKWVAGSLKTAADATYTLKDIAVLKYGPDGRLYLGGTKNFLYALTLSKDLKVNNVCSKNIKAAGEPRRFVLGLAFNPKTTALKLYFSTSSFYWKRDNLYPTDAQGWTNGKVQSITLNGPGACFNDDVTDVVTGLPVSNHDHGINFLQFLPDGRLLISVGGFTNGGVSVPTDKLGGVPANPYSGSIVTCPTTGAFIKYSNIDDPAKAAVTGGGCSIYAIGLRNSFGGELHTNGNLYVTDNGPNAGFGEFSTNCEGGEVPATNEKDSLIKVEENQCHGHPHLGRAKNDPRQCVRKHPECVKPLLSNLKPSTNGVIDYRSNYFNGGFKGNLFLTRFGDSPGKTGQIHRVQLDGTGGIKSGGVNNFFASDSGLSVVEGPRGEMIMSRVYKDSFYVWQPVCETRPKVVYLVGVHPRRGPAAGGHKVTVSGFNFGTTPTAKFGAEFCTNVQVIDDDSFTCVTPPNVAGAQVKVIVEGSMGENFATEGSDYWYW